MELARATWAEISEYLKKEKTVLLPVGSTEQHGPTGLLGTDFLTAQAIANAVGEAMSLAVAPPLAFGVAPHHMEFAGTISLRPATYQALLREVLFSLFAHGFRRFHLVNGHGGNEPSIRAAFQECKASGFEGATFQVYSWWKLPEVEALAKELYGDREGMHATPSEVSLTYWLTGIGSRPYAFVKRDLNRPWPMSAREMRQAFPDGVIGADPGLARGEHGERFLRVAGGAICQRIREGAVWE